MAKFFTWTGILILIAVVHFATAPWNIHSFCDDWRNGDADAVLAEVDLKTILNSAVSQMRIRLEELKKETLEGALRQEVSGKSSAFAAAGSILGEKIAEAYVEKAERAVASGDAQNLIERMIRAGLNGKPQNVTLQDWYFASPIHAVAVISVHHPSDRSSLGNPMANVLFTAGLSGWKVTGFQPLIPDDDPDRAQKGMPRNMMETFLPQAKAAGF